MNDDDTKDELRARFEQRTGKRTETSEPDERADTHDAPLSRDADDAETADQTSAEGAPGGDSGDDTIRSRKQVPMYLTNEQREEFNSLYERLDARSKLSGGDGVQKNKEFMGTLVEFALENEAELAERLGVPMEDA